MMLDSRLRDIGACTSRLHIWSEWGRLWRNTWSRLEVLAPYRLRHIAGLLCRTSSPTTKLSSVELSFTVISNRRSSNNSLEVVQLEAKALIMQVLMSPVTVSQSRPVHSRVKKLRNPGLVLSVSIARVAGDGEGEMANHLDENDA